MKKIAEKSKKMNQRGLQLKSISTMKSLLEGTHYVEDDSIAISSKIFNDGERLSR